MKPIDAENTIKKLKYPKHLRHLSIERLEILAKIFTPRGRWMMNIWNENYIVKIAMQLDADNPNEAIQELEHKLETGEVNLNRMEFFLEGVNNEN